MDNPEHIVAEINAAISELPAGQQMLCRDLCAIIRQAVATGGEVAGTLALALVGAEAQAKLDIDNPQ